MKKALLAGILLYGCTPRLNEVKGKEPEAVLENLSIDGVLTDARISFDSLDYIIRCDNGYYFRYQIGDVLDGGIMCLGNFCYYDEDDDNKVDGIWLEPDKNLTFVDLIGLNNRYPEESQYLNQRYSELLHSLKQDQVHRVWKKYWRNR